MALEQTLVSIEVKHTIACPHCGKGSHGVTHLINDQHKYNRDIRWGPWYCDECGGKFSGVVKADGIYTEKQEGRSDPCWVFLKYHKLILVVKGSYNDGVLDPESISDYWSGHTCPINVFHALEEIIDTETGEIDPHEILEFLDVVPASRDVNFDDFMGTMDSFKKLMRKLLTDSRNISWLK